MAGSKKSSVGEKRAAARRQNRELREHLSALTNQQLKGFFAGFETDQIDRIEKAIDRVKADLKNQELQALDDQIKALTEKRKKLSGN